MTDLRTRFGFILALALLPVFLFAGWLAFDTGRVTSIFVALASLGFAYAAIWFATDALIFKHLRKIESVAQNFATGDLSIRIGTLDHAPPRIASVAQSFDSMANNIAQREMAMLDSIVEKERLLREIHHRVKNNLQIIISLLNMQERKITDPVGHAVIRETRTRINAIALVHRGLYEGEDLSVIDMGPFLTRLMAELRVGLGMEKLGITTETDIKSALRLNSDRAIPVALFIVEALTNAVQHGVPQGGLVRVALELSGDDIVVSITDSGDGPASGKSTAKDSGKGGGTGSKLMTGFARQLSGRLETQDNTDTDTDTSKGTGPGGYRVALIFAAPTDAA